MDILENIWYWENTPYSLAQIAQGNFIPTSEMMQVSWEFAQDWLAGKPQFILPTSGSTGIPKNISITREQMQASALATFKALSLASCKKALLAINPQYVGGKMMLVRALMFDWELTGIPPVGNPLEYLNSLYDKKNLPTYDFIAFVPAQLYNIAKETPELLTHLNHSKAIILGGGAVGKELETIIQSLDVPIYNTYGMTETVSHIALRRLNGEQASPYFRALEGVSLEIDERACLRICSAMTHHEWIQTHDVVELIDSQTFHWLGRADNILNTGGIKIQIEVLEAKIKEILSELGIDAEIAIIGIPDEKWQQKIVLYIESVSFSQDTHHHIKAVFQKRLSRFETPKEIFYETTFPRTPTGKIIRNLLGKAS